MYGIVNKAIEDLVIPNKELVKHRRMTVVNCFQNCILAYNSQLVLFVAIALPVVNCFQNCILAYNSQPFGLPNKCSAVVNCFQNCILAYNSQQWTIFF